MMPGAPRNIPKPIVFCPPLATFGNDKTATEQDITEGFTVTVECDECPEAARVKLEAILGPATTVIRSGGVWNDGNGVTQDKLHLHWRLAQPARGRDDLVKLKRVREICAHLVGADPTSIPICHPIRWPGSWHRKAQPRLTEIVACNPDIEIDLAAALAKLEPLAPTPRKGEQPRRAARRRMGCAHHQYPRGQEPAQFDRAPGDEDAARRHAGSHGGADAARHDGCLAGAARRPLARPLRRHSARGLLGRQEACRRTGGAPAAAAQPQPQPTASASATTASHRAGAGSRARAGPAASSPIEETLQIFERWLILPSRTPVYAHARRRSWPICWTAIRSGSAWSPRQSSAKTELLNSISGLPFVVSVSTLTLASLLSGTPKRQRAPGATGGLLRQVGNPGLLCLKDFTSTITMRPDSKAEVLSALREIFDGKWTRFLGTDGGKPLHWAGKLGLVFGCTGAIDTQHSVSDALGNRFLLSRLEPGKEQLRWALRHVGGKTATMRRELAEAVNAAVCRAAGRSAGAFRAGDRSLRARDRARRAPPRRRRARSLPARARLRLRRRGPGPLGAKPGTAPRRPRCARRRA